MLYTAKIYSQSPRIEVVDDFLSIEECEHFISLGVDSLNASKVMGEKGGEVFDERRTSQHCWVAHGQTEMSQRVADNISNAVGFPTDNAESFQLVHYSETQEYQPHFDAFSTESVSGQDALERGGQRLITALVYLNRVAGGGNTNFPNLDLEVEARPGRMVIFQNCYPGTDTCHPDSLHGGMPVSEGEKWALNLWFREGVFC